MEALSVCCFVFATICGWASCVRARTWTYPGHWCGVAAVVCLAVGAWPSQEERPPPISQEKTDSILAAIKSHMMDSPNEHAIHSRVAANQ